MRWLPLLLIFIISSPVKSAQLLILGDSLSSGYQMPIEKAWPSLLSNALAKHHHSVTVINASISGDTSGNGLARLPSLLKQHNPNYVLIELGANDGLRGFMPQITEQNLSKIIALISQSGVTPILMQIRIPPNYGKRYSQAFAQIYPKLAKSKDIALIPFFMEQVILRPQWMKKDGHHPNQAAQPWIADWVAQQLAPLL
jgi:acyl-CoA thioesterase-1